VARGLVTDDAQRALAAGEYYSAAIEWYAHKYLSCITEKVVFLYYTIVVLVAFTVSVSSINSLFPLAKQFPIISSNEDVQSMTMVVKLSHSPDDAPVVSLARYLVEQYVERRESYDFRTLEESRRYILHMSTSSARLQYENDYLSRHNASSMLLRYQRDDARVARVTNVRLVLNRIGDPYKATADVEAEDERQVVRFSVELYFDIPSLNLVHAGYVPLFFRVSKYRVLGGG
jgi:type IV secretory pathway component VirB8